MGNSHSIHRAAARAEPTDRDNDREPIRQAPEETLVPNLSGRSVFSHSRHSILNDSWRRQSQRLFGDNDLTSSGRAFQPIDDRAFPPDAEDRPTFHPSHDPPIDPNPQRPLNWRHSTMSRLGSRLLPETVARSLTNSGEETPAEGQALRTGLSNPDRSNVLHQRIHSTSNERDSGSNSFLRWSEQSPQSNRSVRASVRRLFSDSANISSTTRRGRLGLPDETAGSTALFSGDEETSIRHMPTRSSSRLVRVRNSLSTSMGSFFRSSDRFDHPILQPSHSRPSETTFTDESDELLPQSSSTSPHHGNHENATHEPENSEPESRNILSGSRITSGMSTIRRFPHGLRSRSTRLIRRGEHPPLTQVLQLAAAAIAAQLHGSPGYTSESMPTGTDAFDGSIQNFVQTLQEVASAQAGQDADLDSPTGELPPVNFLRVFQFPNDENGTPIASLPSLQSNPSPRQDPAADLTERSVTLVLVGVRSMPNVHDGTPNEHGTLSPSLDTLLRDPFLPPANVLRNGSSGALFRRSDTRTRPQNRRHSMTNFHFPQQYESQRHSRHRSSQSRAMAENSLSATLSDSPPGPNPPPSTPADVRSGNATPIRRPSSASAAQAPGLPDLNEDRDSQDSPIPAELPFNISRQRRRSDSEFARRPELSSGNSRRNGVVEPDRPLASTGRSWLIYVIGTNVTPDHPAFTMPSLFTDNPSYEDMQMLSNLLGPVKPPVATQEEVEAAGGLFRILRHPRTRTITAEPLANNHSQALVLSVNDRCLICLCDYEDNEQVRRIDACGHVYHRECVDEWLTTGRNSCPMCRRQGVKEARSGSALGDDNGHNGTVNNNDPAEGAIA